MLKNLFKALKGEYLIVHTKVPPMGGVYPRGFCVYMDDAYLVLQENMERQLQLDVVQKFSKPFYVVPLEEIRGVAAIDPQERNEVINEVPAEEAPAQNIVPPEDGFRDIDFDDQLPQSYVENYLKK